MTIPDTADRRSRQDLEARHVAREAGGAWAAELLNGGFRYASAFFAARILGVESHLVEALVSRATQDFWPYWVRQ